MFSLHSRLISHLRPYTIPELWKFWFFSENLDVFPKSWILNSESQIWTVLLLRSFKIVFRTVSEKFQWLSWQKTCEVSISRGLNYPFWGLNCPDFTVFPRKSESKRIKLINSWKNCIYLLFSLKKIGYSILVWAKLVYLHLFSVNKAKQFC